MTGGRHTPNPHITPRIIGLCTGHATIDWFAADQEGKAAAKAICAECPSTLPCYATAISNNELFGIWGGVDFSLPRYTRGLPGRQHGGCGTDGGYKAHKRNSQDACNACKAAHYQAGLAYRLRLKKDRQA